MIHDDPFSEKSCYGWLALYQILMLGAGTPFHAIDSLLLSVDWSIDPLNLVFTTFNKMLIKCCIHYFQLFGDTTIMTDSRL